jgi:hypothetical protein
MEKNKMLILVVLTLTTLTCGTLSGLSVTATPAVQKPSAATATLYSEEQPTANNTLASTPTVEVEAIPILAEIPVATNPECQNDYLPVVLGANWIYAHTQTTDQSSPRHSFVYIEIVEAMPYGFTTYVEHSNSTEFTPAAARIERNSQFDPVAFYFPSELIETPSARYVYWACLEDGLGDHNAFMVDIPKEMPSGYTWSIDPSLGMNRDPNKYTSFGFETVTVPAGTFNAVKVKEEWSRVSGYHWYAPGIGKVKSHYSPEAIGIETVMELLSYEIPSFTPASQPLHLHAESGPLSNSTAVEVDAYLTIQGNSEVMLDSMVFTVDVAQPVCGANAATSIEVYSSGELVWENQNLAKLVFFLVPVFESKSMTITVDPPVKLLKGDAYIQVDYTIALNALTGLPGIVDDVCKKNNLGLPEYEYSDVSLRMDVK